MRGGSRLGVGLERRRPRDFSHAAACAHELAAEMVRRGPNALPDASLLSVNVPAGALRGCRVTFLGRRVYRDQVDVRQDLRGRSYYWIGGHEEHATDLPGSDLSAVRDGL